VGGDELWDRLGRLSDAVERLDIVSDNEQVDDVATRDLKFLLVPHLRALAALSLSPPQEGSNDEERATERGTENNKMKAIITFRESVLRAADRENQTFLRQMRALGGLSPEDRAQLSVVLQRGGSVADECQSDDKNLSQALRPDPRVRKIARYKHEQALIRLIVALRGRSGAEDVPSSEHRAPGDNSTDEDDERLRDLWRAELLYAVSRSIRLSSEIADELQLVQLASERLQQTAPSGAGGGAGLSPRNRPAPPSLAPGLPSNFRIMSGSALSTERQEMRAAVFRPTHTLPTFTVEEWGTIEAKQMAERAAEQAEAEAAERERIAQGGDDSDNEGVAERNRQKAIEWDTFVEKVNKGSGNTLR